MRSVLVSAPVVRQKVVRIIGCANGNAGRRLGCENAAMTMQNSPLLAQSSIPHRWHRIIEPVETGRGMQALTGVVQMSERLANETFTAIKNGDGEQLTVIGGDHSCAIGTWSGVASALRHRGHLGLLWVDAHLDAHTPATSETGNIHGMPIAHLLGIGHRCLTAVGDRLPKLLPSNLVMLGIRSYEPAEQELLESLRVRIFYMAEIERRGLVDVLQQAFDIVNWKTAGFGLSIDLDGFRVQDAPAVGTPERGGLVAEEFLRTLSLVRVDWRRLVGTEIVEFLPELDDEQKTTEKLVMNLIETVHNAKHQSEQLEHSSMEITRKNSCLT